VAALVVAACIVAVLEGCGRPEAYGNPSDVLDANAVVTRIVDGDTLGIQIGDQEERVRLIGINTPESVDRSRPVMCFGKEATAHLTSLLPPGTPVRVELDVEPRDRYDRMLAYVHRASDGRFVNLAMVEDGFADQYTFPPNVAHTESFGVAARTARSEGRGLWSACERPFEE
jgi:micrococcal nuclease